MQEHKLNGYANRDAGEDLCHPMHRRTAGPREPKEPDREENSAQDHGQKTLLRDWFTAISEHFPFEAGLRRIDYNGHTRDNTESDTQEGEGSNTEIPMPLLLKGDGIGFEKEVDDAIDKGHVEGYEEEDRFPDHHHSRAKKVPLGDISEIYPLLISRSVKSPVFRLEAETAGFLLEEDGGVALAAEKERDKAEGHGQDECHICCPSPSEVIVHYDEAACDWACYWPDKDCPREQPERKSALYGAPKVSECTPDDGHCCCPEDALKEPEEHDCFDVAGDCDGDLENCKGKVANEQRGAAAIKFACGKKQISNWRFQQGWGGKRKGTY